MRANTGNSKHLHILIAPHDFAVLVKLAESQNTTTSEIVRRQIKETVRNASVILGLDKSLVA